MAKKQTEPEPLQFTYRFAGGKAGELKPNDAFRLSNRSKGLPAPSGIFYFRSAHKQVKLGRDRWYINAVDKELATHTFYVSGPPYQVPHVPGMKMTPLTIRRVGKPRKAGGGS